MIAPQLLVFSGAAAVAGTVGFVHGFRDLRTFQIIRDTPTAKIRSMAMGLVEINGEAETRSLVTAPFSGRQCAYWQVEVAVRGRRDNWSTVHRNSSGQPFFIRDETGLAMIYPKGAQCRLNYGVEEVCQGINLPSPYTDYFTEQKLGMSYLWRMSSLRFRESTLDEGEKIFVLGSAMPKPQVLVISDGEAMAATGTDGDTWAGRVKQRSQEAIAVIRRGENERVFIISQSPERELEFMLGVHAWVKLVGGPLLAIGGLAFLLNGMR
jgi:hypothetical protein